jgi:hypothetical protein
MAVSGSTCWIRSSNTPSTRSINPSFWSSNSSKNSSSFVAKFE